MSGPAIMQDSPNLLFPDLMNERRGYAETIGNKLCRATSIENAAGFNFRNLGCGMLLATLPLCASLCDHVSGVCGVRPKPKMFDVYAIANITCVANAEALGDRAVRLDPHKPVDSPNLSFPSHIAVAVDARSGPKDAAVPTGFAAVRKSLGKCPVPWCLKSFSFWFSHWSALLRRLVVRAAAAFQVPSGPFYSATSGI